MKYLVLTIRKPQFDHSVIPAHYAFLRSLRDGGLLEQAGPFTDRSGRAYVIRAESFEAARELVRAGPAQHPGLLGCQRARVRRELSPLRALPYSATAAS